MATGRFVRGALSATLVVLLVASQPAGALTQEQVTAEALAAYERMASGYNWTAFQHIFLDPGYRQYEAGYLAWSEAYNGRARLSRFVESGDVSHLEYLLGSAEAIYAALRQCPPEERPVNLWLYRGAWQEWEPHVIDMVIPLSRSELGHKIFGIFKHQSQKDKALFPGPYDDREFWQRAEARNRQTAERFNKLGLPEYHAMEAFVRWRP